MLVSVKTAARAVRQVSRDNPEARDFIRLAWMVDPTARSGMWTITADVAAGVMLVPPPPEIPAFVDADDGLLEELLELTLRCEEELLPMEQTRPPGVVITFGYAFEEEEPIFAAGVIPWSSMGEDAPRALWAALRGLVDGMIGGQ